MTANYKNSTRQRQGWSQPYARMTRSMQGLSGAEFKVLAALRRLIPDGEQRKMSNAEIAAAARVGEGTVSTAMPVLEQGHFLKRHFLGRGRGRGYRIEMLTPPDGAQEANPS